jgi:hypothetical protein
VSDFSGVQGTLTAFDELTRANIQSLSFSSLTVTLFSGGDQQVAGEAIASVNGASTQITFQATSFNGVEGFAIRDSVTGDLLAGGNGEPGRADIALSISVL